MIRCIKTYLKAMAIKKEMRQAQEWIKFLDRFGQYMDDEERAKMVVECLKHQRKLQKELRSL